MKKIYSGYLNSDDYGEHYDGLMLANDFGDGLIADISNDCYKYGNYVKFRYYISDKEFDLKDLDYYIIGSYSGLSDIRIESCGCPTCGYMCVESATIEGHDIFKELSTYIGKFAILEVDYYKSEEEFKGELNG
jgi:hypothetical protein